jgi:hypothetical protein
MDVQKMEDDLHAIDGIGGFMSERRFGHIFSHGLLLVSVFVILQTPFLMAQQPAPLPQPPQQPVDTGQPVPVVAPDQLDSLVAPIALYPDPVLSQILVASTYPLEVVEANQWVQKNAGLSGPALTQAAAQQNWDPSVQALVVFPNVLKQLNEDVNWTTNLGNAFLAQQSDVMAAVQRMRTRAEQAGKLKTTPQEVVQNTTENGQPVVVIMPPDPDVVYLPEYDPLWIWGPPVYYAYPRWHYPPRPAFGVSFVFGGGVAVGGFFGAGWGGWGGWGWHPAWGSRAIIVNNVFIRRYNFNRAHLVGVGERTAWVHDPYHRMGVPYPNHVLADHYHAAARANLRPGGPPVAPAARGFARTPAPRPAAGNRGGHPNNGAARPAPAARPTPHPAARPAPARAAHPAPHREAHPEGRPSGEKPHRK